MRLITGHVRDTAARVPGAPRAVVRSLHECGPIIKGEWTAVVTRDSVEHVPALDLAANGRNYPDGSSSADPAHLPGPLPQATFAELIGRLVNDLSDLADRQIELARQEIRETKDDALITVKRTATGGGIIAAGALLLVIALWSAFIWFFNWAFGHVMVGTVRLDFVGWILGIVLPVVVAYVAYMSLVRPGINHLMAMWPLFARTRATLKEDLEWVKQQRTRSAK
jgi:hypothetical protein